MKGSGFLPIFAAALVPLLVIALLVSSSLTGLVQWRPPVLWTDQFGAANLNSRVTDVSADSQGIYAVGYLNQNLSSLVGAVSVRKYNLDGGIAWIKEIPVAQAGRAEIAVGSDGMYETGSDAQNITLWKYDFAGDYVWSQQLQSSESPAIFATSNGLYLAGRSTGTSPLFLSQHDSRGTLVWTDRFSNASSGPGFVTGIYATVSTVFVLTDGPLMGFGVGGAALWSIPLGIESFLTASSIAGDGSSAYVSGTVHSTTLGITHGFLTKYDGSGRMVWNRVFESPCQSGVGYSDVWTDSSGVYLAFEACELNYYVVKYDFSGNQQWVFETPIASGSGLIGTSVPNGFVLAGSFGPTSNFGIVQEYSGTSSLILFGLNPPLSFVILGGLVAGSGVSLFALRRLRKGKRPSRVGPPPGTLPTTD